MKAPGSLHPLARHPAPLLPLQGPLTTTGAPRPPPSPLSASSQRLAGAGVGWGEGLIMGASEGVQWGETPPPPRGRLQGTLPPPGPDPYGGSLSPLLSLPSPPGCTVRPGRSRTSDLGQLLLTCKAGSQQGGRRPEVPWRETSEEQSQSRGASKPPPLLTSVNSGHRLLSSLVRL